MGCVPTIERLRDRPHEFFCSACRHELHDLCERECPFCGSRCLCPHGNIQPVRHLPPWALAAIVVFLAALAVTIAFVGAASASACHHSTALFGAPDNACTPGAYVRLSRAEACSPKVRPTLPARERRRLLSDYGVPDWTGSNGEIDHRVPLFLGGLTVRGNLWPESGSIPNPKDRLEAEVRQRVCARRPTMRVRTAVRLFLADWRHAYRALVAP